MQNKKDKREYLLFPYYHWIIDNKLTPEIAVDAEYPGTKVPKEYIEDGIVVLNLSPLAVRWSSIDKQGFGIKAIINGQSIDIYVPFKAILSITCEETNEALHFDKEKYKMQNKTTQRANACPRHANFSQATMEVAKCNIEEFKARSDEGFLIRAEINRKLS